MLRFAWKARGARRFNILSALFAKNSQVPSRKDISLYLKRANSFERDGEATQAAADYEKVLSAALSSDDFLDDHAKCELALRVGVSPTWLPALASALSPGMDADELKRDLEHLDQWLSKPSAVDQDETVALVRSLERAEHHLTCAGWLYMYCRLLRGGFALAAYEAKCAAARCWLREYNRIGGNSFPSAATAVAAALYVSDFCAARRVMADLRLADDDEQRRKTPALEIQVCIASGDADAARSVYASMPEATMEEHVAFRNLVEGAQLAVVGPAVNKLKNGSRIDAYDLIVRPNFKGARTILAERDMLGSRTDISYYNVNQYKQSIEAITSVVQQLKYGVFQQRLFVRQLVKGIVGEVPVRHYIVSRPFFGIGYALRSILNDLILFSPTRIVVHGADFFLSDKLHYDGYWENTVDVPVSYVRHDVFDCFIAMRLCMHEGLIEADGVLAEILGLSFEDFCARVSERCLRRAKPL